MLLFYNNTTVLICDITDEGLKHQIEQLHSTINDLETKLQTTKDAKCKQDEEFESKLKEINELYESEKSKKEKANVKLRSYKDKILKCATCINQLKNSRYILTKTVKEYSENIPRWRNDLINASKVLDEQLRQLSNENSSLKEEVKILNTELEKWKATNESIFKTETPEIDVLHKDNNLLNYELTKMMHQFDEASNQIVNIGRELAALTLVNQQLSQNITQEKEENNLLTANIAKLQQQCNETSNENISLQQELTALKLNIEEISKSKNQEIESLKSHATKLEEQYDKASNEIISLQQELSTLKGINQQLNDSVIPFQISENKQLKEQINENIKLINDLSQSNVENEKYIDDLKNENKKLNDLLKSQNNNAIETLHFQIKALESEKATLLKEKLNAKDSVIELEISNKRLTDQNTKLKTDIQTIKHDFERVTQENVVLVNQQRSERDGEINLLKCKIKGQQEQYELLKEKYDDIQDLNNLLKEEVETLKLSLEHPKDDNLSDLNVSLQADIVKLETKLAAYKQENASLLTEVKESRNKNKEFDAMASEYEENKSMLLSYKSENTELLSEMKEINQALKERGESISKQQKAIAEMERLIETLEKNTDNVNAEKVELLKKIETLENMLQDAESKTSVDNRMLELIACEKDKALKQIIDNESIIVTLKEEIEKLKHHSSSGNKVTDLCILYICIYIS